MLEVETFMCDHKMVKRQVGKFFLLEQIGCGGTSVVLKAVKDGGDKQKKYACKVISRENLANKEALKHFEQELRIHMQLDHPNICKIDQIVYEDDNIYLFMDYCSNGDLFQWISRTSIINNYKILFQIVSALAYLHERGITHLDIKPENILVDEEWNVKLADFGNCGSGRRMNISSFFGTIEYAPPEVFSGEIHSPFAIDVWQLGVLAYEMFVGEIPWKRDPDSIAKEIIAGDFTIPSNIPSVIQTFIKKCLEVNPKRRADIFEIQNLKLTLVETPNKKFIKSAQMICWKPHIGMFKQAQTNRNVKISQSLRMEKRASLV